MALAASRRAFIISMPVKCILRNNILNNEVNCRSEFGRFVKYACKKHFSNYCRANNGLLEQRVLREENANTSTLTAEISSPVNYALNLYRKSRYSKFNGNNEKDFRNVDISTSSKEGGSIVSDGNKSRSSEVKNYDLLYDMFTRILFRNTDISKSDGNAKKGRKVRDENASGNGVKKKNNTYNRNDTQNVGDTEGEKNNNENNPGYKAYTNRPVNPILLYLIIGGLFFYFYLNSPQGQLITWKVFENELLARNLVDKIVITGDEAYVYIKASAHNEVINVPIRSHVYRLRFGSIDSFEKMLDRAQSELGLPKNEYLDVYYESSFPYSSVFLSILPPIIYIGLFFYLFRNMSVGGAGSKGIFSIAESRAKLYKKNQSIDVKFKDVAGIDEVKEEVQEFVKFLSNPSKYESLGAKIPKGAILSGPPGTGKTLLARATAGEASVPFYSISGSEFIEMFAGVGASRVRDLFETAKKNSPCIIFIDEIDAIGKARGRNSFAPGGIDERESTLNQLLVEMDGFSQRDYVVVFAGTNRPETLDSALTRPGRFDRHIHIDLPVAKGRKEILKVHIRPIKTSVDIEKFTELLSSMTAGFSGADLRNVCNEAALIAARKDCKFVEESHFFAAIDRIIAGTEKKSVLLSSEEKKIVAYHEAGHVVVGWFLEHSRPLLKVSIIPRSSGALGFTHFLSEEKYLQNPKQFMDLMCTLLAGRACEYVFFDTITSGASDDIKKVTTLANVQIKAYGMSDAIGNVDYMQDSDRNYLYKPYSEHTSMLIDAEVKKLINTAYERTLKVVRAKVDLIKVIAERLIEKEVLEHKELVEILGPRVCIDARVIESNAVPSLNDSSSEVTSQIQPDAPLETTPVTTTGDKEIVPGSC